MSCTYVVNMLVTVPYRCESPIELENIIANAVKEVIARSEVTADIVHSMDEEV